MATVLQLALSRIDSKNSWWIRFLWKLMPSDYRRDMKIWLMRAGASWQEKQSQPESDRIYQVLNNIP
jgi:hypothetical protein